MANATGLDSVVSQLKAARTDLASQLRQVDAALSALGRSNGDSSYANPKRTLSAAARKKISRAQKARWAAWKAKQKKAA